MNVRGLPQAVEANAAVLHEVVGLHPLDVVVVVTIPLGRMNVVTVIMIVEIAIVLAVQMTG